MLLKKKLYKDKIMREYRIVKETTSLTKIITYYIEKRDSIFGFG